MDIKSINSLINANKVNKSNDQITNKECSRTSFNSLLTSRKESNTKSEIPKEKLKEIKGKLQDMGFSKEDVESVKSLDDLKKLVKKSLDDKDTKDDKDIENILLNMIELILKFMNNNNLDTLNGKLKGNKDTNDLLKIMDKDSSNKTSDLLNKLESLLNKFTESQESDELSKSILEAIQSKLDKLSLENLSKGNKSTSILENIKNKLNKALSQINNNSVQENSLNSLGDNLNKTVKLEDITSKDGDSKEFNRNTGNGEKDFLEGLLKNGEDNKDKIDKTVNFMSHIKQDNKINIALSKDTSANIVLNKDNLNNDLIKAIKFMNINDMKDLTVKIMPKELGEVVIKLTMEAGIMKANIAATSKETYNLLNANLNRIEDQLQQNNIKVQDVSLNIYEDDTTFFKDGFNEREGSFNEGQHSKNNKHSINSVDKEENLKDNISDLQSNVNMLA